jgi:allophanate hydrolase subunit 2
LQVGDTLPLRFDQPSGRAEHRYPLTPKLHAPEMLRVMLGPQSHRFERIWIDTFLDSDYSVSSRSDRSGLRLEGPALRHVGGYDSTSEGVAAGSIQVPGSGLPVILIGDHPTVGGYPKIATIISADLAAAGRLRIGSRVRFQAVSEGDARAARAQLKARISETLSSMTESRE